MSEKEGGATPRPWEFDGNCGGYISQDGERIARAYAHRDAAFIVKAVNSYDAAQERIRVLESKLADAAEWCAIERGKLGAVDGYDYHSGEEYGLRRAEIELRRRAALSTARPIPEKEERK